MRSLIFNPKWGSFKRSYFQKQHAQPFWDNTNESPKISQTAYSKPLLTSATLGHVMDQGTQCGHYRHGTKQTGQNCSLIHLASKDTTSLPAVGSHRYRGFIQPLKGKDAPHPLPPSFSIQVKVQFFTVMPQKAASLSRTSFCSKLPQ